MLPLPGVSSGFHMWNDRPNPTRREMLAGAVAVAMAPVIFSGADAQAADVENPLVIDTHQHLWDPAKSMQPTIVKSSGVHRPLYGPVEYAEATRGLNVKAVYMEVDSPADQRAAEAEYAIGLCHDRTQATIAAVIGAWPDDPALAAFIERFKPGGFVRGIRQVLHASTTPPGMCLKDEFVRGIQFLGKQELSFDLCMRPAELSDGLKLSHLCPDTRFIVDHCGNADPVAFLAHPPAGLKPAHDAEVWKRDMAALAKRPNVICKISGIVARAPEMWSAEMLAPIVDHCLDSFGPDRVVFGGDWPICLKRTSLGNWIEALKQIVAPRPVIEQRKLWADNAMKWYKLAVR